MAGIALDALTLALSGMKGTLEGGCGRILNGHFS